MTFPTTHPALARALAARGYTEATAVQRAVLEAETTGRDLLVSAQTGSGKTIAFGLAIATTLLGDAERFDPMADPLALIIAPTRELALQVQRELAWLYAETGARVITCVGGMDPRAEARQLEFGAHIVVGTPGRLRDHIERRRLDLTKLRSIVLDEADEMLDLGFREDLEFILEATPKTRQTLLFSATLPREIEALAASYQSDARRIATVRRDEQHADIEYRAIRVAPQDVENAVVNLLRFHDSRATLVFCATRDTVKRMHARLSERGFSAVALSGELSHEERTHGLQALRDGRARVLVATDVAARGLDLPDLALVIHADLPNDKETLLHRSGRTGRAGRKGLCFLIVAYNRRRKAEALIGAARLKVTWEAPPTADQIRALDQERFLADPMFVEPPAEEDVALARLLQAARTPDEIALALVRMHRARLPAPEDLSQPGAFSRREDRPDRARDSSPRNGSDRGFGGKPNGHRNRDTRDMVWFRLGIGRDRNADPRWLLPLICRAGGVSKAEIGSIKIYDRDTRFQVVAEHADAFAASVRVNGSKEGHISRVGSYDRDAATAPASEAPPEVAYSAAPQAETPAAPPEPVPAPAIESGSPAVAAGLPERTVATEPGEGRKPSHEHRPGPEQRQPHGARADRWPSRKHDDRKHGDRKHGDRKHGDRKHDGREHDHRKHDGRKRDERPDRPAGLRQDRRPEASGEGRPGMGAGRQAGHRPDRRPDRRPDQRPDRATHGRPEGRLEGRPEGHMERRPEHKPRYDHMPRFGHKPRPDHEAGRDRAAAAPGREGQRHDRFRDGKPDAARPHGDKPFGGAAGAKQRSGKPFGAKPHWSKPHGGKPHAATRPAGANEPRPPSKYARKKKHRTAEPAKS